MSTSAPAGRRAKGGAPACLGGARPPRGGGEELHPRKKDHSAVYSQSAQQQGLRGLKAR